jgi:hypothetical protein
MGQIRLIYGRNKEFYERVTNLMTLWHYICSIGQIWTTVCLIKTSGVNEYVMEVQDQRLLGHKVQQVKNGLLSG